MQTLLNYRRFRNRRPFDRRFFVLRPSRCLNAARHGVLPPCPLRPSRFLNAARRGVLPPCPLRRFWCLDAARCGVLQPVHPLRRSWCLDAARCGVLPPCPLRPSGVPQCCQAWSVAAGAPFAPFLVHQCCQVWSIAAVPFAPVWCLPGASMLARYTHYSKSQKLEFWKCCPLMAAHYRLYRASRILGNCKQM